MLAPLIVLAVIPLIAFILLTVMFHFADKELDKTLEDISNLTKI